MGLLYSLKAKAENVVFDAGTASEADLDNKMNAVETSVETIVENPYVLPAATSEELGGVKVGNRLSISDGVLSASDQSYSLPIASSSTLGGIKVGNNLSINSETGVLDAAGSDTSNCMIKGIDYVTAGMKDQSSLGTKATAEGYHTTAYGSYSHAEGSGTSAVGNYSHAEGYNTYAKNAYSHAEGYASKTAGDEAHAEGRQTTAGGGGDGSHAEGCSTSAYGAGSHAEGFSTSSRGHWSHAEGYKTYTYNQAAHAEGYKTCAYGENSHAEGRQTTAYGSYSHVNGLGTYASANSQTVIGKYNEIDTNGDYAFIIGNGSSTTASNAFGVKWDGTVMINDQPLIPGGDTSNCMMKGVDYVTAGHDSGFDTSTRGTAATEEGFKTYASGNYSHAEGYKTCAYGIESHVEGYKTCAEGIGSHAEGGYTTASGKGGTFALGENSHAEGIMTSAIGNNSHAEGYYTCASGNYSHAEGYNTTTGEKYSHAEGRNTAAFGEGSHVEGWGTYAEGGFSHAEGNYTTVKGAYCHAEGDGTYADQISHAEGYKTTANNFASHTGGHWNAAMTTGGARYNQTGTAFVIGNGTSSSVLSNAFSIQYNGTTKAANTITASTTADYAEMFEWIDGNPHDIDRVGYFVTTANDNPTKITIADANTEYILGIVSGAPFVLGNGDCDVWNGMMVRDEFGRIIYDEPGVPRYNPNYDPSQPYISRLDRKEWAAVGMLGVLAVRDDGTCQVNGYCTVGDRGVATRANRYDRNGNCYKVIDRINDKVIKVIFR